MGPGASLDALIEHRAGGLERPDRALYRELSSGSLRWYWRCKGIVDLLVKRPLKKRDRVVEALMVVGVYQLERMRLPAHAAIHATVEACVVLGRPACKGLVNGVLRNFQRNGAALTARLAAAARDAHPDWLWRSIHDEWPAQAPVIIQADNSRPPMTLRVNARLGSVEHYQEALVAADMEARPVPDAGQALVLSKPVDVKRLPGFERGLVSVQDVSAQRLVDIAPVEPGQRVLDACAAPGGKLTHLLEAFPGIQALALERDPERAARITENLGRLGLAAELQVADAADPGQWWDGGRFDLVVLDAPCTGTGVIRRHPDIKVLRRESDTDNFAAAQQRLLDGLWPVLKPGGRLVYVTCSILARENHRQVEDFLQRTPDAREIPLQLPVGTALPRGWQILPDPDGGDGFFYALLSKVR